MATKSEGSRLPIKLIMPKQGTERRVPGGGGKKDPFRVVDSTYRTSLLNQVVAIEESIIPQLKRSKAAPIRVKLISKATAKTHRPETLFSDRTCPIIGAGGIGELFVKASKEGIENLKRYIREGVSETIVKELSCIESIEAVSPSLRRGGQSSKDILTRSPRRENGYVVRVRLHDFGADSGQPLLLEDFLEGCKQSNIAVSKKGYSTKSFTYSTICRSTEDVEILSRIVGVRSVTHMPRIRTVRPTNTGKSEVPELPMRADGDEDFPVVAVVDSGITANNPALSSWVVGRDSHVAPPYRNTDHGTFVAGLICWGKALNPSLKGVDDAPCGVFDLQVIPNHDPAKGDISELTEEELLISLESALQEHANKYKVWNLSLSTDAVCSLDEFSTLAVELDNLQERYQVSFVISAGNYNTLPLLEYPRKDQQLVDGRITSPADSVLGITVGSVSHIDPAKDGKNAHHPSAFSRHGAGPNYIIKPDLVHYGGACSTDAASVHGICSIMETGLAEDIGTSFSTPLVSRTLAQIYHQITPTPSPEMSRALLTHHARDPRSGLRVPDGEENYLGFGLPAVVPYCLECTPHSATLVFEDSLRPGYFLEWDDFPYPHSLKRDGRYFGEVWMTLAFSPSRGERWGSEYCETHIDAHLGVYYEQVKRDTGEVKVKFGGLVPPEHKNPGLLYEAYQVEKLRKWAPVRTYHGAMGENGEKGLRWRLKLQLLSRHGVDDEKIQLKPQKFALIITIADPLKQAPVYDEMSRIVMNRFQAENLAVRGRSRVRATSKP